MTGQTRHFALQRVESAFTSLWTVELGFFCEFRRSREYSCAVVVVITPEGRAKAKNATAIITINTGREKDVHDERELDSYWWGRLKLSSP